MMSSLLGELDRGGVLARRHFVKKLGAGALGVSMFGGGRIGQASGQTIAQPLGEDDDQEEAILSCSRALLSTERRAGGSITIIKCKPCDCSSLGQNNRTIKQKMLTKFTAFSDVCDRLSLKGFPVQATCEWIITKKEMILNPQCGSPLSSFSGKFTVRDLSNNDLIKGKVLGTVGFDPCRGQDTCCQTQRVMGTMSGKGVNNSNFAGCVARWVFCGTEQDDVCSAGSFAVIVSGLLSCPC